MNRTTVLLAEDHMLVREGLRRLLESEPDLEVVGEAPDGRQAITMAVQLSPDVVLMDIAMPGLNGLEATRQILKFRPETKIVVLTAHIDDAYIENAIASGAVGFLLKQNSVLDLCRAIREAQQGHAVFRPPSFESPYRPHPGPDGTATGRHQTVRLTSREMEVLQLITEGYANKQTAMELGISIKTVEKHRGHLMNKLGIHETAGLTRYAIAAGIIESSVQLTTH